MLEWSPEDYRLPKLTPHWNFPLEYKGPKDKGLPLNWVGPRSQCQRPKITKAEEHVEKEKVLQICKGCSSGIQHELLGSSHQ